MDLAKKGWKFWALVAGGTGLTGAGVWYLWPKTTTPAPGAAVVPGTLPAGPPAPLPVVVPPVTGAVATVIAPSGLKMHESPATGAEGGRDLGTIPSGTRVGVLQSNVSGGTYTKDDGVVSTNWSQVSWNGTVGFVAS